MGLGALGSGYCYKSGLGMFTILEMVLGLGSSLGLWLGIGLMVWFFGLLGSGYGYESGLGMVPY